MVQCQRSNDLLRRSVYLLALCHCVLGQAIPMISWIIPAEENLRVFGNSSGDLYLIEDNVFVITQLTLPEVAMETQLFSRWTQTAINGIRYTLTSSSSNPAALRGALFHPISTANFFMETEFNISFPCTNEAADNVSVTVTFRISKILINEELEFLQGESITLTGSKSCTAAFPTTPDVPTPPGSDSGDTGGGGIGTTTVIFFQLQLQGVGDCPNWVRDATDTKLHEIATAVQQNVEEICQCGFSQQHILDSEFRCFSDPDEATFRGQLHGTAQASSSELISHIEQWIASGVLIRVQRVRLPIDSTCRPVAISSFTDPECGSSSEESQDTNSVAVVGGVLGALLLLTVVTFTVIIALLVLRIWHLSAELAIVLKQNTNGAVRLSEVAKSEQLAYITAGTYRAYEMTHTRQQQGHEYEFPDMRPTAYPH